MHIFSYFITFLRIELELSALGDRQIQTSSTLDQRCSFWNNLLPQLNSVKVMLFRYGASP